jgi:prepilin-type N-terminal cleavage/methylation domain-containing protein
MKKQYGFTILEVIVSILIFTLAILLVNSMYTISQRSYNKGSNKAELVQNARVSLDRISREIRQSVDIVTDLPETNDNPEDPPVNEIFFQDGHDISQITYLRYYLNNSNLMRRHTAYYFDEEPETYVTWNSVDEFDNPPEELIFEDRIVGEYFDNLEFWGSEGLVHISIELSKNQDNFKVDTSVYSRNW